MNIEDDYRSKKLQAFFSPKILAALASHFTQRDTSVKSRDEFKISEMKESGFFHLVEAEHYPIKE